MEIIRNLTLAIKRQHSLWLRMLPYSLKQVSTCERFIMFCTLVK